MGLVRERRDSKRKGEKERERERDCHEVACRSCRKERRGEERKTTES